MVNCGRSHLICNHTLGDLRFANKELVFYYEHGVTPF